MRLPTDMLLKDGNPTLPVHNRAAFVVVSVIVLTKALIHLLLVNRYGFHGDELYFIECGRHLALGYVDHAPLIPWIARAAEVLGGASLLAIRLPAIVATSLTLFATGLIVREWGGGVRAQVVTLLSLLVGPAYLRLGGMLNIPVIEVFLCTTAAYLVVRALSRREIGVWPYVGVTLGLAFLTKHTVVLWIFSLAVGLVTCANRRVLATRGPWVALAIALAFSLPNVVWEARHGFPTLEFSTNLRHQVLAEQGRLLFVLGQVLYFHPFVVPVWVAGLLFAFMDKGRASRPFAVMFLVMFASLLVLGGKPYYLASAYPPVFAAGGVALEYRLRQHAKLWRALVVTMAITGSGFALLTLPLLPIQVVDEAIGRILGRVVPPMALTHDMHGELGWDVHVQTVDRVVASLSPEDRARTSILTGSYSEAAALNVLRTQPEPRAVSGHMNYYLWPPAAGRGDVLIAYGVSRVWLARHYGRVELRARVIAPLARPWDTNLPVYVCRDPVRPLSASWPELRRFDHRLPSPDTESR